MPKATDWVAVKIEFAPKQNFVFVLENYSEETMRRFAGSNPRIFDAGQNWRWWPVARWKNKDKFFKWLGRIPNKLDGWTVVGRLDD